MDCILYTVVYKAFSVYTGLVFFPVDQVYGTTNATNVPLPSLCGDFFNLFQTDDNNFEIDRLVYAMDAYAEASFGGTGRKQRVLADFDTWLCPECGGEYSKLVSEFIANPNDCPYCNDRKPLTGYNTLAVRYPTLLGDWDYTNNYVLADPDQILPTSSVKVWWTCHNDPSHHYPQQVSDKVLFDKRHQESCIYCKGRRRKKHHFV